TVTWPSRCPDTGGRYKSRWTVGAGGILERSHEPETGQVVAGDRGLNVGGRQQRRPRAPTGFESQWPAPRDQVAYEGGHLIDLGQVGGVPIESQPSSHIGQGTKQQSGAVPGRDSEL